MSERRRTDPLPLGGGDEPYLEGADGPRADARRRLGRSRVRGRAADRAGPALDASRTRSSSTGSRSSPRTCSAKVRARRRSGDLRRYSDLDELDLPIIVLIGGATGTGKSTVATEVAYRLGITRVTSTDFVRQTLRAFFSPEFMPSIHYSSFEAGRALRSAEEEEVDPLLHGFLDQTRNVLVGVERGHRALARRGLVDRARGRPPRARDARRRSRTRSSSSACSRSRAKRRTRAISGSATSPPRARARSTSTSITSPTSGTSRTTSSSGRKDRTCR